MIPLSQFLEKIPWNQHWFHEIFFKWTKTFFFVFPHSAMYTYTLSIFSLPWNQNISYLNCVKVEIHNFHILEITEVYPFSHLFRKNFVKTFIGNILVDLTKYFSVRGNISFFHTPSMEIKKLSCKQHFTEEEIKVDFTNYFYLVRVNIRNFDTAHCKLWIIALTHF